MQGAPLDEIARAVSDLYCPHTMTAKGLSENTHPTIKVLRQGAQPVIELRYGVPVAVDAGQFPQLLLMQTCLNGTGTATQASVSADWRRGQTLPLSPGVSTQLEFDARYAQRSVRLDIRRAEALCARLINHDLDRPLQFELRPFSEQLEKMWSQALDLLLTVENGALRSSSVAAASLDEFLLSLLLTNHPHNYTKELQRDVRPAPPRLIREAEYLMANGDTALTVSQIASHLRVSLRTLEAGFQECRGISPLRRLREIRLRRVREQLLSAQEGTSVTSVATENGFLHLPRFSAYYRAAFGEAPHATLRRSRTGPAL
jgi:AraC-like DNA-binding protein